MEGSNSQNARFSDWALKKIFSGEAEKKWYLG